MKTAVLATIALVASGCGGSHHAPPGQELAQRACNDWHTVSAAITGPDEDLDIYSLGRAVTEARDAADIDGRYTELWKTLNAYQVIVTSGAVVPSTYPTSGGDSVCADI